MPYDSDLRSNIKYANSLRHQPAIALTASSWLSRRINSMLSYFTADGLTKLLFIFYISALLILGTALFRKNFAKFARKLVIMIVIVFMIFITILSFKIYHYEYVKSAIVLDEMVDARYEPLIEAPVHFKIYEGTKIVVLRARGDWLQIKREDNKIGWIPSTACGII
jgi:signal transduction histidine kinase